MLSAFFACLSCARLRESNATSPATDPHDPDSTALSHRHRRFRPEYHRRRRARPRHPARRQQAAQATRRRARLSSVHAQRQNLDTITAAGCQVIERARIILAEAANIRSLAANLRNDVQGELRIATTHTQARFALPGSIAALKRSYPQVNVHLLPGGDTEVLELLARGQADLAVVSSAGAPPTAGLALPAYRWDRAVLVPNEHPLAALKHAPTLAELAAYPLVSYESSLKPESSLRHAFVSAGLEPRLAITALDADLIKTYVRVGLGVGVLAEMALLAEDAADLRVLSADGLFPICTTWIVLPRDRVLRDFTLEFIAQFAPSD